MNDHPLSTMVREFYDKLNKEVNFVCRVNSSELTPEQNAVVKLLSDETMKRYYGSGMIIPELLEGKRILDLGCGSGSLVFILSKLVGPRGYVVGVDISKGLIETARGESDRHSKLWGYEKANFEFHNGNVERISDLHLEPASFDLVVSNGVFCLCPDKKAAFNSAFTMLKEGGQFFLNDVYAEKACPDQYKNNETLWSLGAAGALPFDQLASVAREVGFTTPYLTSVAPVDVLKQEYNDMLANARFVCAGWRLFKLYSNPKPRGASSVTYKGNIPGYETTFPWDVDLKFKKGEAVEVDGELATLLSNTYLSESFTFSNAKGNPVTKRNQKPFDYMDKLAAEGRRPEPIYKIE